MVGHFGMIYRDVRKPESWSWPRGKKPRTSIPSDLSRRSRKYLDKQAPTEDATVIITYFIEITSESSLDLLESSIIIWFPAITFNLGIADFRQRTAIEMRGTKSSQQSFF
jgi:hypothetical protein